MRNDKLQKAKALDELFASRLEKLLIRLRSERVITFESDAVMRGYLLAEEPSGDRPEEYRAYMNLRYHALNKSAEYFDDDVTRRGILIALDAIYANLRGYRINDNIGGGERR